MSPAHALLLACMHRAAHLGIDGHDFERLIWLYDIELLAAALPDGEWSEFVALCGDRKMCEVARDAFRQSSDWLGTSFPSRVLELLSKAAGEPSADYLRRGRARLLVTNLRATTTWDERIALVRESLFPPAGYMLAKYGSRRRWLLPWWYLRRAVEGAVKLTRVR